MKITRLTTKIDKIRGKRVCLILPACGIFKVKGKCLFEGQVRNRFWEEDQPREERSTRDLIL
jgi:hypothetical protein